MLTPQAVTGAIRTGVSQKLSDGHGLYLVVKNGRGFWVYQFWDVGPTKGNPTPHGHTRSTCLGTLADLTPAAARHRRESFAVALRDARREERDIAIGKRRSNSETFGTAATAYLDNHSDEWSARHRAGLRGLVKNYVTADLSKRPVTEIKVEHVADVLRPIWNGPGDNRGSRLRRLIEGILSSKQVEPNPAAWSRLRHVLSTKTLAVVHRKSMPAADVPAFVAAHAPANSDVEQRALRFVILTGVRRKEALQAQWSEFDLVNRVWTVPASRMKMKRAHAVPLTDAMIACLGERGADDVYVFSSKRTGGPLASNEAVTRIVSAHGYTLHGFRSSFGTWAEEQDDGRMYPKRVIDAALAHGKEDAVTAAYLRSDQFAARRKLMKHWSGYVTGVGASAISTERDNLQLTKLHNRAGDVAG